MEIADPAILDVMAIDSREWRRAAGLSLASVAASVGITGRNPAKTYSRYETGQSPCPAEIVEKVQALSEGRVGAEDWHRVRLAFLRRETAVGGEARI